MGPGQAPRPPPAETTIPRPVLGVKYQWYSHTSTTNPRRTPPTHPSRARTTLDVLLRWLRGDVRGIKDSSMQAGDGRAVGLRALGLLREGSQVRPWGSPAAAGRSGRVPGVRGGDRWLVGAVAWVRPGSWRLWASARSGVMPGDARWSIGMALVHRDGSGRLAAGPGGAITTWRGVPRGRELVGW